MITAAYFNILEQVKYPYLSVNIWMRIRLARGDGAAGKKQCYSKEKKYDYSHKNDSIEVQV